MVGRLNGWIVAGTCFALLVASGCAPRKGDAPSADIDSNRISMVRPGMALPEVLQLEGPPTDMKNNVYYYRLRGRIVFEGTVMPTDKTKVLRVEEDLAEDGYPN